MSLNLVSGKLPEQISVPYRGLDAPVAFVWKSWQAAPLFI